MKTKVVLSEIEPFFEKFNLDQPSAAYVTFHKYRYKLLLDTIQSLYKKLSIQDTLRILDAGPAFQTALLRNYFSEAVINTIGFNHKTNELREGERHYRQDFNECHENWNPHVEKHHIILFCEVIEHLYTPPQVLLKKFNEHLLPGGFLIIQTPNAVAIHKRLRMAIGIQPFQLLQKDRMGHFREYTKGELIQMITQAGFENIDCTGHNYFNYSNSPGGFLFQKMVSLMPASWRDGWTLIAKKD